MNILGFFSILPIIRHTQKSYKHTLSRRSQHIIKCKINMHTHILGAIELKINTYTNGSTTTSLSSSYALLPSKLTCDILNRIVAYIRALTFQCKIARIRWDFSLNQGHWVVIRGNRHLYQFLG